MPVPFIIWGLAIAGAAYLFSGDSGAKTPATQARPRPRTPSSSPPAPELPTRGTFSGKLVFVIGTTGAGKSSLINRLCGVEFAPIGDVASTTREVTGYVCASSSPAFTFVDTPGIGEAGTHDAYRLGLLNWFGTRSSQSAAVLLVVQADGKAHADDVKLARSLRILRDVPLVVALNQCDKLRPSRGYDLAEKWDQERLRGSEKSTNVAAKIAELERQLTASGVRYECVVPVASECSPGFNIEQMASRVAAIVRS